MNCNQCPYMNGNGDRPVIRQIQGNSITFLIPMTSVLVNSTNGVETRSERSFPISDVKVLFVKKGKTYNYGATSNTNVITVREPGELPIGCYDIIVTYKGTDGQRYRYRQNTLLEIVDAAESGGNYQSDELDVISHYPTIKGKVSAISVGDTEVSISEGRGYTGDATPNDAFADISAEYGENTMTINDNEIIITI